MLQHLQGNFPYFYSAEKPMPSYVRCTALAMVCAYSYLSYPHVYIPCQYGLHIPKHFTCTTYSPKYAHPPMSRVHSTARSNTLTVTFALHNTFCHLYTSWNSPSCVHCKEVSVTYAFQNINEYFVSVEDRVLSLFVCQGVSSATLFLSDIELCHFVSVRNEFHHFVCHVVCSGPFFLSRSEFLHFVCHVVISATSFVM